jgi:UDP-N-acetylglucosamine acyltransferase
MTSSSSSSPRIHPTACIDEGARLAADVQVGPFAVIEADVELGAGCVVGPHCVIRRWVRMGERNTLAAHVVLGEPPQHLQYDGAETWLVIGDDNVIREGATINRAYEPGAATRVGNRCYLMGYTHIAHDCVVGDDVIMTNYAGIAGHTVLGNRVILGGGCVVHQWARIGDMAMISGHTGLRKDVLPFTMVGGWPARHYRLNAVGLRRQGVSGDRYRTLERACRAVRAGDDIPGELHSPEVSVLRAFLDAPSKRGITPWTKPGQTREQE